METDILKKASAAFAPILYLHNVAEAIEFYKKHLSQKNCVAGVIRIAGYMKKIMFLAFTVDRS